MASQRLNTVLAAFLTVMMMTVGLSLGETINGKSQNYEIRGTFGSYVCCDTTELSTSAELDPTPAPTPAVVSTEVKKATTSSSVRPSAPKVTASETMQVVETETVEVNMSQLDDLRYILEHMLIRLKSLEENVPDCIDLNLHHASSEREVIETQWLVKVLVGIAFVLLVSATILITLLKDRRA